MNNLKIKIPDYVHITKSPTGKMEGIQSINTNTLTNPFCKKASKNKNSICNKCYSIRQLKTIRTNCIKPFQHNSNLLSKRILNNNEIPTILQSKFRFNSHSELINLTHLKNLMLITTKNPHCTFALWFKRYDLIKQYFSKHKKPKNLILVFSNSILNKPIKKLPLYVNKTFNNVSKDYTNKNEVNCSGKCKDCLKCYTITDTTRHIIEYIK